MKAYGTAFIKVILTAILLGSSALVSADPSAISGTWDLDEKASDSLEDEIDELKQEYRQWMSDKTRSDDPDKPVPFESGRKFDDKQWDSRRSGPVPNASVATRTMVEAESIKVYVSDRIIVAYDGKLKRLISPNPAGRVHSATGKGVSKDAVGETLAYVDGDAFVIETRTNAAERLAERFELTSDDELKITTSLKNPEWRRTVEFVRFYERN